MGKRWKEETGLLSLEACIAVTIFIFLMLFMYSFFVVFEARNAVAHAVLATADSLALDAYENNVNRETRTDSVSFLRDIFQGVYGFGGVTSSDFVDDRLWYENTGTGAAKPYFQDVIRTRFLTYLGGGNKNRAEDILKRYHIQGGAAGLDFSESEIKDGKLFLSVQYTIEYEFQVFHLDVLNMQQSVCSKLWT